MSTFWPVTFCFSINNCLLKQSCKYEEIWANFSSAASDLENRLKELVNDSDKDMSKLLHCTQWIFNMLKSVLGRALLCYVPKKKNLGRLIYRNGADVSLSVFILSETYNFITFLKICAAWSRLSCFLFFFKSWYLIC
jgi:hypothetical protein